MVWIKDYARMRELFGIEVPGPQADEDALAAYIERLRQAEGQIAQPVVPAFFRGGSYISGYGQFALVRSVINRRRYLAFDARNVDQSVMAGVPEARIEAVRGSFDPEATDLALSQCPEKVASRLGVRTVVEDIEQERSDEQITLSKARELMGRGLVKLAPGEQVKVGHRLELLEWGCPPTGRHEYGGISFYSWSGEDVGQFESRFRPPAFGQGGKGGRIAVQDKYVFRTIKTDGMKALIDASRGRHPSLANVEEFRLLAVGLSELAPIAMLLGDIDHGVKDRGQAMDAFLPLEATQEDLKRLESALEKMVLLRRYQAAATGIGWDTHGPYMVMVLAHSDSESAEENVGLLRQRIETGYSYRLQRPWAEMVDTMEISAEGSVLIARLHGEIARHWALRERLHPLLVYDTGLTGSES